jgi:hypothetical protein
MKEIPLSKGYVTIVDDADYDWLNQFTWHADVRKHTVYAARNRRKSEGPNRNTYMHRELAGVTDPKIDVDHHDLNGLNNTRDNLRVCNRSNNHGNKRRGRLQKTSSRFKGVYLHTQNNNWVAQIMLDGMCHHLGSYDSEADAARAYDVAAVAKYGEFARVNFPKLLEKLIHL